MKRFSSFIALAMVAGLVGLVASPASAATTHWVNDDGAVGGNTSCTDPGFTTISAAVTAAASGDTIEVCEGTYPEGVLVDRSLTILGPNAGSSALGARVAEAHITSGGTTVLIQSPDVIVDGFQITGDFGVYIDTAATSNVAVENNIISATSRALDLETGPGGTGYDFHDNSISSPVRQWHVSTGPNYSDVSATGNRFSGDGNIFFSGNTSIDGYEFSSNEVLNSFNNMAARISDGDVSLNTFNPTPSGPDGLLLQIDLHDSTVTGNTFDGNDTSRCLQLFGVQFGLDPSENVLVSENTFTDCGGPSAGAMWALQLSEGVDGIDILNNEFTDTKGDSINTRGTGWTLNDDIHINRNSISGSTGFGVNNTVMGELDAVCNWWGSPTGPMHPSNPFGTGDAVSDNVLFNPWLNSSDLDAPDNCVGGTPRARKLVVRSSLVVKQAGADEKDAKRIEKAIEHLDKSLADELWEDDTHLNEEHGKKVFDEEKKVVDELGKVKNTDVSAEILEIVDIDHDLAQTAHDEATAGKEKDKAAEELAKGDESAAQGKYEEAINRYKKAWEHAIKAG